MSREHAPPADGTVVVDEERGRVGEVAGRPDGGRRVRLRPLRGGRGWDADPARVRTATPAERLRATLAAVNAVSRSDAGEGRAAGRACGDSPGGASGIGDDVDEPPYGLAGSSGMH